MQSIALFRGIESTDDDGEGKEEATKQRVSKKNFLIGSVAITSKTPTHLSLGLRHLRQYAAERFNNLQEFN